jgi:macrolide transport system ATP-binding/permease protein
MRIFQELARRLQVLLHRDQFERDLEEEMQHHLAMKAEEAGDMYAAQRAFGNVTLLKEDSRTMWTWTFAEQLAQDIRYALRMMARNPLFTAMATLSLALGIGANTAIYSFMDAVLLRSLPVQRPQELAVIRWRSTADPAVIHSSTGSRFRDGAKGMASPNFPYAAYEILRANQNTFSTLFGYAGGWDLNLVNADHSEVASGLYVTGNFYSSLGVTPAIGRLIIDADDRGGAAPVAVLSFRYWQSAFGASPAAIGKSMLVNNVPVTIAGVSAPGFYGLDPASEPKVYLPLHSAPLFAPLPDKAQAERFLDKNSYWIEMMGRLRPGVTLKAAETVMAAQFHQFVESTATTDKERRAMPQLWLMEGSTGIDSLRRRYSQPLYILMTMVGLILMIACANIANLLLARAAARKREIAVRLSLGAGRLRIVRQLLTESVMLSLLGGVLGLIVALWGIRSITWLLANGRDEFTLHAALNWPVLGFTLGLSVMTGIVFGLAPAIQATGVDLTPSLKQARSSAVGRSGVFGKYFSASRLLVVAQISISLLLVVGAGLFVRTLANLESVDLGFNRENLLLFTLNARQGGYKEAAAAKFYADLHERLARLPGVQTVALCTAPLAIGNWNSRRLIIPGAPAPAGEQLDIANVAVDPYFLQAMQIPVVLGRGIEERDMAAGQVAVVTEKFAQQHFPGKNPVGRMIGFGDPKKDPANVEIIGIAKTTHYNSIKEDDIPPVAYIPYTQNLGALNRMTFVLRTNGDPLALANAARRVVQELSPNVPITDVNTQAREIDQTISQERTFADLCSGLAFLALAIACVGLYGTMAYSVARRTGEIGIRMALGAERAAIIWMVLREVCVLAVAGLAIGLAAAWQTTHLIASFLYGTKPNDPLAIGLSVAILAAAALAAGYTPAWRASKIDPITALRQE